MLRLILTLIHGTRIPRLVWKLMLDRRISIRLKIIPLVALLYLLSPIDLFPDIVPLLSLIDDGIVILLAITIFLVMAPSSVVMEHFRAQGLAKDRKSQRHPNGKVIEGSYRIEDDDAKPRS